MKGKVLLVAVLVMAPMAAGLSINSFDTFEDGTPKTVFEDFETATFQVNATNSTSASVSIHSPSSEVVSDQPMSLVSTANNSRVYQYNYSFSGPEPGEWNATVRVQNQSTETEVLHFDVAGDTPRFLSIRDRPIYKVVDKPVNITAEISDSQENVNSVDFTLYNGSVFSMTETSQSDNLQVYEASFTPTEAGDQWYEVEATDSASNSNTQRKDYYVFDSQPDRVNITVSIAPDCGVGLDFFLLPGDGEIVQNKTGVFVQIVSNTGNVKANGSIDYLNVTQEGQDPWSPGELKGPVIRSYPGETFLNMLVDESETYFEFFKANYETGNYTAHTQISSECRADGPQQQTETNSELNQTYTCNDINASNFSCYDVDVLSTSLVDAEVQTLNFTNTSSQTVSEQANGTTAYESSITLNSTTYNAYLFNSSSTPEYDYSCLSTDTSIDESGECAFENNIIEDYIVEVSDVFIDGSNATYALKSEQEDLLNTSLECENLGGDESSCNYTFNFFESFTTFGNFEIVTDIGSGQGGVNQTGNQTTNQTIPGAGPEAGTTPEPEPEPVPEPEPDPVVRLDIESVNETLSTSQGQFVAAAFEVTNIGTVDLSDITLRAIVGSVGGTWQTQTAQVTQLSVGETVTRDVFIQPSATTPPGSYVIPVVAESGSSQLDLDYFTLNVKAADFFPRVEIEEAPTSVDVVVDSTRRVPLLLSNPGRVPVSNVSARLQNLDDCGSLNATTASRVPVNGTSQIELFITASDRTMSCNSTLVVSSAEGAYAFSRISVNIIPRPGIIPVEQRVPFIAVIWTAVLMAYAIAARKYSLDSLMVQVPFILLILGEVVILLYVFVNYYGIGGSTLLPF